MTNEGKGREEMLGTLGYTDFEHDPSKSDNFL